MTNVEQLHRPDEPSPASPSKFRAWFGEATNDLFRESLPGKGRYVAAVICANGLGHYYRTTNVLETLQRSMPGLDITVIGPPGIFAAENDSVASRALWARGAHRMPVDWGPGLTWSADPEVYEDGRLTDWLDNLVDNPQAKSVLDSADLVLSDNLGLLLDRYPNTVMMGNFTWGSDLAEVYPDNEAVKRFAQQEKELLARATMLCVGAIASKAVLAGTHAVPFDWMAQNPNAPTPKTAEDRRHVAVFGGSTGMADARLAEAAKRLVDADKWDKVSVSSQVYTELPPDYQTRVSQLPGGLIDYSEYGAIVVRPGVGAITAAVESGTPLFALDDTDNPEMVRNSTAIQRLGIGIGGDLQDVVEGVERLTGEETSENFMGQLRRQGRNGILQATTYLALRLITTPKSKYGTK